MEKIFNKKTITDIVFITGCLLIYVFFPAKDLFQQIVATITFFVIVPLLYKKFILKEKLSVSGFSVGSWQAGLKWGIFSLLATGLLLLLIIKNTAYLTGYELPLEATKNFGYFIFYELLVVSLFVALYEIFFRGFVMFSFTKNIGYNAILLQFVIFLLLFSVQNQKVEFIPYLIFTPFAGLIAYKSKSIIYSFLGQYAFIFLVDISIIKMLY